MLTNYIKIAIRNLVRHKLYTFINLFGLSIGIAFSILIMLFVRQEFSFDNFHENKDRIFRVLTIRKLPNGETHTDAFQPMPLIPALLAEIPEIKYGTRFSTGSAIVKYGNNTFSETIMFTDPAVFSMFTFDFLDGNPQTALQNPDGIILNETMAKKYFGGDNALGKILTVTIQGKSSDLLVTGVFHDLPDNSSLKLTFIASITKNSMYERSKELWTSANGSAFVQLADNARPDVIKEKLGPFIAKYFGSSIERGRKEDQLSKDADAFQLAFEPLTDVHLDTKSRWSPEERSNPLYSYILAGIGMFVLMIACINFMTLAIGRSATRAREVGIRKVLGAFRTQLMGQFWGEAFLLCFIAMLFGLVLTEIAIPSFNQLTHRHLALQFGGNGWLVISLVVLLTFIGLIAGSYPAAFLSRFQPVEILKGKLRISAGTTFTKALIVLQFGLSTFLIVGSIVMSEQLSFILNKGLGYNADQVLVLQLHSGSGAGGEVLVDRLRTKLSSDPNILNVSGTNGAFTHGYDINGFKHHGVNRTAYVYRVDDQFLATLKIQLKDGRNFNPKAEGEKKGVVLVNEKLAHEFGWKEPFVGTRLEGWNEKEVPGGPIVIGVLKDFNFSSLKEEVSPAVFFMDPDWPMDQALVRISPANMQATMDQLRLAWNEIAPDKPFEATFLDDDVEKQYESERQWQTIISISSSFAIALACLGLFGLATLTVTNRTKEIGIRKVLGASVLRVLYLLSREFVLLILISNVIAWPIAYYVAREWLNSFAYRIALGPLVFVLAGALALTVALLTVSVQAMKAALANPVDSLRYE